MCILALLIVCVIRLTGYDDHEVCALAFVMCSREAKFATCLAACSRESQYRYYCWKVGLPEDDVSVAASTKDADTNGFCERYSCTPSVCVVRIGEIQGAPQTFCAQLEAT